MRENISGWIKLALKFLFSFAILFYMVETGRLDLSVVSRGFSQVHLLVICALLMMLGMLTAFVRWNLLLKEQGLSFPFSEIVRYGMVGQFFNTTMPGAVSGDLIKAWYVINDTKGQKKTPVLASILLDRVMGVFGLVIVSTSPILFAGRKVWETPQLRHFAWIILALFAAVMLFLLYFRFSSWGPLAAVRSKAQRLERYRPGKLLLQAYDSWMVYGENPMVLVKALLLAAFNHLLAVTAVIFCASALGEKSLELYQYFLLVPIGLLTTAIPIAPAGLGVGHVAFAALFSLAGSGDGAEVFTLFVTIQICLNLTGVFFYLRSPKVSSVEAT